MYDSYNHTKVIHVIVIYSLNGIGYSKWFWISLEWAVRSVLSWLFILWLKIANYFETWFRYWICIKHFVQIVESTSSRSSDEEQGESSYGTRYYLRKRQTDYSTSCDENQSKRRRKLPSKSSSCKGKVKSSGIINFLYSFLSKLTNLLKREFLICQTTCASTVLQYSHTSINLVY